MRSNSQCGKYQNIQSKSDNFLRLAKNVLYLKWGTDSMPAEAVKRLMKHRAEMNEWLSNAVMGDMEFKNGKLMAINEMKLDKDWNMVLEMCTLKMEGKENSFLAYVA